MPLPRRGRRASSISPFEALAHASSLENIGALAERGAVSFELFLGGGPPALITRERAVQDALFRAVAAAGGLMGVYPDDPELSAALDCGGDAEAIARAHPAEIEAGALMAVLSLAAAQRCRVHVRQTSTALTALVIGELRRRMPDLLTAEVTPHHLVLTMEDFVRWGARRTDHAALAHGRRRGRAMEGDRTRRYRDHRERPRSASRG